ncbi:MULTISPECIES: CmpA/NrtA family ABC transporter substrate-binding protein [unclassified Chelatococcus]|uniref:CmpA/NrtA family ABC transporter substrate-binding protein n=1 Tax=unclassified Chelatococcus TaxID=2638111 RepID=UPI001BD01DCF|nr:MULTISPECIES: CmpA/NrtA family ABC transporter substrate-binding protein [unclassified Chelatococcus]MBS7699972.1 ABC transporter substrate-binding protein [Chelatococcus sp. YT9]MBX3558603.1 ABC transporter substrate-binding protein [Chelatococcus sp.]
MSVVERVTAGFLPLLDSAVLVTAREKGFAASEGIELVLIRENSWASIRDRLAVGHFDVAHVLAPMPIAFNLGLAPLAARTVVPMALGLGGNAITVSLDLWRSMRERGASESFEPASTGAALHDVIEDRARGDGERLRFAVVHPHSGHNYELRYWLAACGINPDTDVNIVIVPPPLMADALTSGRIDGYCVGEPWNTAAIAKGGGRIATIKAAIWKSSPEKVLGVSAAWAELHPQTLSALLRAVYRAAQWCADTANREELSALLAQPAYIGAPAEWLLPALSGRIATGDGSVISAPDFFLTYAKAATFPWKSHALWFYSQMVRWGQVNPSRANDAIAHETYRPDLYRAALKSLGAALPTANSKVEGALTRETPVGSAGASLILGPDGFFDGRVFDPDKLADYLVAQTAAR